MRRSSPAIASRRGGPLHRRVVDDASAAAVPVRPFPVPYMSSQRAASASAIPVAGMTVVRLCREFWAVSVMAVADE
jgi:hypothetical protein